MEDTVLEQTVQCEMQLLRPEVRSSRDRLEELLDDEFIEIGASGRMWHRDSMIDNLVTSAGLEEVVVTDVAARRVADRVVLITYASLASEHRTLRSSLWRETDGHWRCFFYQGTVSQESKKK